jgi:hypothetical protein
MAITKEERFQIVLNLPASYRRDPEYAGGGKHMVNMIQPLCYYDFVNERYTWVDEFDEVRDGKTYKSDEKIKVLHITVDQPSYYLKIDNTALDVTQAKQRKLKAWFENWPLVAHAASGGKVFSFPTKNHQRYFAGAFKANPKDILPMSVQPLKMVDETKVESLKNEDLKRTMKFVGNLNLLESDKEALTKVAFLLGLNPIDMEPFEIQNSIYEYVLNNEYYEGFQTIFENKAWDDPATLAVAIACSYQIISQNQMGRFQFAGEIISQDLPDAAFYFRANKAAWNALRIELEVKGHKFPEDAVPAAKPAKKEKVTTSEPLETA